MKNTVSTFLSMKQNGERLTEITSYDYTTAKLVEKAGINAVLTLIVYKSISNLITPKKKQVKGR